MNLKIDMAIFSIVVLLLWSRVGEAVVTWFWEEGDKWTVR